MLDINPVFPGLGGGELLLLLLLLLEYASIVLLLQGGRNVTWEFFLNTEQRKFQGQQNILEKPIFSEMNFRK